MDSKDKNSPISGNRYIGKSTSAYNAIRAQEPTVLFSFYVVYVLWIIAPSRFVNWTNTTTLATWSSPQIDKDCQS